METKAGRVEVRPETQESASIRSQRIIREHHVGALPRVRAPNLYFLFMYKLVSGSLLGKSPDLLDKLEIKILYIFSQHPMY